MPIRTPPPHYAPDPLGAAGDYTLRTGSAVATSAPINRIVVEWPAQPRRVSSSTVGDGVGLAPPNDSPPTRGVASDAVTLVVNLVEQSGGNYLHLQLVRSDDDHSVDSGSGPRPGAPCRSETADDEELAIYAPPAPGEPGPSLGRRWKSYERTPSGPIAIGPPPADISSHPYPRQAREPALTARRWWPPIGLGAVIAILAGVTLLTPPGESRTAEAPPTLPSPTSTAPSSGAVLTPSSRSSTPSSTDCALLPAAGWIGGLYGLYRTLPPCTPGSLVSQAPPSSPADCPGIS